MTHSDLDSDFLKTLTVLYVEDDSDARKSLVRFLQRRVGTLITAINGADGLEEFRTRCPHIVITDILMPVMDGLAMAQEIRHMDPGVPIIVTTAFEQTDYLMRSIEIGVDKYVTKPIDSGCLNAALLECAHRLRAEEQLRRKQKLETEALRDKHLASIGILIGGMAHDFNNLLQVILGGVFLAKIMLKPGSKAHKILDSIEKSSDQAHELSQRLLTYSYGGNGLMRTIALAPFITTTVDAVLDGTAIACEYDLPEEIPAMYMDELQMRQVISCVTANALDAMPSGGTLRIAAFVRTISEKDELPLVPGDYVHLTFRDTGGGIPPDILPKIFDPYFTTKQMGTQKGMGLGLALCHMIIRRHDGMIRAESPPGEGAAFHIYLPVADGNGDPSGM
jgi:signal transduction histidine kinase